MKPKKFKQAMQTQKLKKKLSQTPQKLKLRLKRLSKKKISKYRMLKSST